MTWSFDNSFVQQMEGFYSAWEPAEPGDPSLLCWNGRLAEDLGISDLSPEAATRQLSGTEIPEGAQPAALAYSGHQFGHFSPVLGDGRAVLLGEHLAPNGKRFDVQLKGSGRTPFSRGGDGKYALGPALREHLVSQAMAALGIPTSRSLAVVTTGERVMRQQPEPGAVLTRVAGSHIRVGTFEFAAVHLGADKVRELADYTIARHFPEIAGAGNRYLALLEAVLDRQVRLVAAWMNIGFVHGVMNTDNVAVSGETIDYGPCAFLDSYSAKTVFSSIDTMGRYAFGEQPGICRWNMIRLGSALAEAIAGEGKDGLDGANALIQSFAARYRDAWLAGMRAKLGLQSEEESDLDLANRLFAAMEGQDVDFTNIFRSLAHVPETGPQAVATMFADPNAISPWLDDWTVRIARDAMDQSDRRKAMDASNPLYIPRNHLVEEALEAALAGDMAPYEQLVDAVSDPFREQDGLERFAMPAPPGFGKYVTFCGT